MVTIIVSDTGFPGQGVDKSIASGQVRKVIASHIGTNSGPRRKRRLRLIVGALMARELATRIRGSIHYPL